MINVSDILETITMFEDENLDVRTITMGISLLDCCDSDINKTCARVYDKITRYAKKSGCHRRTDRKRVWRADHS